MLGRTGCGFKRDGREFLNRIVFWLLRNRLYFHFKGCSVTTKFVYVQKGGL